MAFFRNFSKLGDAAEAEAPEHSRALAIPRSMLLSTGCPPLRKFERKMPPLQAAPSRRVFEDEPQGRGLPCYSIFKEWPAKRLALEALPRRLDLCKEVRTTLQGLCFDFFETLPER